MSGRNVTTVDRGYFRRPGRDHARFSQRKCRSGSPRASRRAFVTRRPNVEAWTYWVQGLSYHRRPSPKKTTGSGAALLGTGACAGSGRAGAQRHDRLHSLADARFGWWDDREAAMAETRRFTELALAVDPDHPDAHVTSGFVGMIEGEWPRAIHHVRKAVESAPGSANAAVMASFILACAGHPQEAVPLIERAMQLSPNYPANYLGHLGNAYRLTGRFEEAIAAFKAFDQRSAGFGLTDLVIAYRQTDRPDLARQTAERLLSLRPSFSVEGWRNTQFRSNQALLEAEMGALRAAGLP